MSDLCSARIDYQEWTVAYMNSTASSATISTTTILTPCGTQKMSLGLYTNIDIYLWIDTTVIQTIAMVFYTQVYTCDNGYADIRLAALLYRHNRK